MPLPMTLLFPDCHLCRVNRRRFCVRKKRPTRISLPFPSWKGFANTAIIFVSSAQSYITACHCYQSFRRSNLVKKR
jgi:hypothetical protein